VAQGMGGRALLLRMAALSSAVRARLSSSRFCCIRSLLLTLLGCTLSSSVRGAAPAASTRVPAPDTHQPTPRIHQPTIFHISSSMQSGQEGSKRGPPHNMHHQSNAGHARCRSLHPPNPGDRKCVVLPNRLRDPEKQPSGTPKNSPTLYHKPLKPIHLGRRRAAAVL